MKIFKYIAFIMIAVLVIFFSIGIIKPEFTYTNKLIINATPEHSFNVFTDTARMQEWMPGFKSFSPISGNGKQRGSKWKLQLMQEGQNFEMNQTLAAYKQNQQYSFLLENAVLTNNVDMFFTSKGNQTELLVNNRVSGITLLWKSLLFLSRDNLSHQSELMYENLKKSIEADTVQN